VLVHCTRLANAALVFAKGVRQKLRLFAHALRTAIDVARSKRFGNQFFESLHLLRLLPQQVVKPQHFGHESRSEPKRQRPILRSSPRRSLRDHIAFDRRQPARWIREAAVKTVVQLVAGHRRRSAELP
jgi:hypothetical protein